VFRSIAFLLLSFSPVGGSASEIPFAHGWKLAGGASMAFEIAGSGGRSNPMRRELRVPFTGDELYVTFRLTYPGASLDTPEEGNGEFFVLWLDEEEGGDGATHSGGVPNIGVHVKNESANHFMARYRSGREVYAAPLAGDREFEVVARLRKSVSGAGNPFDQLSLWVDPELSESAVPHAVITSENAISSVNWIGFSTGGKTEPSDRIRVSGMRLDDSWFGVLGLPDLTEVKREVSLPKPPVEIAEVDPPPAVLESDHWSFQPVRRPVIPAVRDSDWVRNPVDAFIAERHEALGVGPAPEVDPVTLRRRISLVLTGLPPDAVGTDPLDTERLLSSQEFGERWGRHWLDVARWAESNGHQHNRDRPHAWKYRDYVIAAFRDDKPFDAFVREQIAGDEIEEWDPEHLVATGFLAAARYSGNELDKKIQRNDILVDITNTTAEAFLGLTMACAQCHDHFFDPVTAWDYYRMQAFFVRGQPGNVILEKNETADALVETRWRLFESVRERIAENRRSQGVPEPVLVIPKSVAGGLRGEERRHFEVLEREIGHFPQAWGFYSPATAAHRLAVAPHEMRWPLEREPEIVGAQRVHYLVRGDIGTPGPEVQPGWPQVFGETGPVGERPRLAFADWIVSRENPLTARVWVNRIWQGYFGRGLVETSGNFGIEGAEPSHSELLDWLASELVDSGWSSRHIHRLILDSATFRQSSFFSAAHEARDPANASLWRWTPRRLESEAIRDSLLAVSGRLDRTVGGPSVDEESSRRSVYLRQKRDRLPDQQMLFDSPQAVTSCARRRVSTVALQPLWFLNAELPLETARALAGDLSGKNAATELVERVLSRPAEGEEIEKIEALIGEAGLEDAALVLLNTNEFLYIP